MKKGIFKTMMAAATIAAMLTSMTACGSSSGSESQTGNATESTSESTGAETASEGSEVDTDAVVTVAITGGWDSLCPLASTTYNSDYACNTIFDNLIAQDGQGGWVPRLAESFEFNEDHTEVTFHLQQNATWHDGEPFTADDVIFSAHLVTDGSYTTNRRLFFQKVDGCDSTGVEESEDSANIQKIDDYTVKVTYKQPVSEQGMLADAYTFFIFPEHLLADADPATILENDFWTNPVGTGPFKFESQTTGEILTVVTNEDYYLGAPGFGKLVVKVVSSSNLLTSMMSGEVDVIPGSLANISDTDFASAQAIDGYTVESVESDSNLYLVLNNETFNTANIRKALAMLMDKEKMIQAGCNGNANAEYTTYSPNNIYCDQEVIDELGYEFDPETAVQMLKDDGFDFDRTYILCINDNPMRQAIMTVYQQTLAEYGITLEIQTVDTQTCISNQREGLCDFWVNGGYEGNLANIRAEFINWVSVDADGNYAPFNLAKIKDTHFMELENQLSQAITTEEIQAAASEIQREFLTEYNYIFMINPNINIAISDRMGGIDEQQMLSRTFNYAEWKAYK